MGNNPQNQIKVPSIADLKRIEANPKLVTIHKKNHNSRPKKLKHLSKAQKTGYQILM